MHAQLHAKFVQEGVAFTMSYGGLSAFWGGLEGLIGAPHPNLLQAVEREHLLIKVRVDNTTRSQILEAVNLFRARVVDVAPDALVIEVTGDSGKVQAFLRVLEPYGIKELAQSGLLAIGRGAKSISERVLKN